jgi:predicted PurR-regulated permease PerM
VRHLALGPPQPRGRAPRRTSPGPIRAVLLAGALVVAGLLFRELVTLLLAVLMAVLLAIPLAAAADRLERRRIPRPIGALAALVAAAGALAGVGALVVPAFVTQAQRFVDEVPAIVDALQRHWRELTGAAPGDLGERLQRRLQAVLDDPVGLLGSVASIGLGIAGVLTAIVLIVMAAYYIAARPQPLVDGLLRLLPPARRDPARATLHRIRDAWIGWMQGVAADMLVTGVLLYLGLTLIGVDFAVVFAVLAGLLVVVPYLGALVSGLLPVLFALTESVGHAALTLLVFVVVQQVEGQVIVPLVMARTVRLHPAVILVGVVVVGRLFGIVGLFVAVPILSLFVILVDDLWVSRVERGDERAGMERARSP